MRYQICTRCIMDTGDPNIVFDENGICNHCKLVNEYRDRYWLPDERGQKKLETLIADIKAAGKGREYDCSMGLSGGVDSSYLILRAKEWGLRILAVHVDAGWNTELAVKNIERMVAKLGIDLHTFVVDWDEMKDLHRAFLKAGVPNQDIPQDHAFLRGVVPRDREIQYSLTCSPAATTPPKSILPSAYGYGAMDLTHIMAIHKRFGSQPLRKYPRSGSSTSTITCPR